MTDKPRKIKISDRVYLQRKRLSDLERHRLHINKLVTELYHEGFAVSFVAEIKMDEFRGKGKNSKKFPHTQLKFWVKDFRNVFNGDGDTYTKILHRPQQDPSPYSPDRDN